MPGLHDAGHRAQRTQLEGNTMNYVYILMNHSEQVLGTYRSLVPAMKEVIRRTGPTPTVKWMEPNKLVLNDHQFFIVEHEVY